MGICIADEPPSQNPNAANASDAEPEEPHPDQLFSVLISIKSFLKFLNSHVLSSTTIACKCMQIFVTRPILIATGICQRHCMILYVYIGDVADAGGVLTFYIPAILDD